MSEKNTVARPYAKAAFEVAHAANALGEWSDMLHNAAVMVGDPSFVDLIHHPKFSDEKALEWMLSLKQGLFSKQGETFLKLLAANRRLLFLPEIVLLYEALRREAEKVVEAEVISAKPLEASQIEKIKTALIARLKVRDVTLNCKLDASLLAGAVIRARDTVIDGSALGKLRRIEESLGI